MMEELKHEDTETWKALKNEAFGVNKTIIPFTTLYVGQNLEEKIKDIKGVGGIRGITQQDDSLNRFFFITPYITKIVNGFTAQYGSNHEHQRSKHYQLGGDISTRISKTVSLLVKNIEIYCKENPFATSIFCSEEVES